MDNYTTTPKIVRDFIRFIFKKPGFRLQMYILCKIIPQNPPNAILTDRLGHIEIVNTLLKKLKEQRVSISVI